MDNKLFNLPLVAGWQDQTVYYFKGPDIDGTPHHINLNLVRNQLDTDINSFARDRIEPIENYLQGLEVLRSEAITVEGGNPVYEYVFRWTPGEGVLSYEKYVFVICDGMGFSFSCSFSKKSLKMLGGQMNDIIEALLPGTYEPLEED